MINTTENPLPQVSNREFWQHHMDDWQKSGIKQPDYCKVHGLKYSTFGYWRSLLLKQNKESKPSFIRVERKPSQTTASEASRSIQAKMPNGIIVNIPLTLDMAEIAKLIKMLGASYA